jgi:hypothetical protein
MGHLRKRSDPSRLAANGGEHLRMTKNTERDHVR